MATKTDFWIRYKRNALLGYVFLIATPLVPVIIAIPLHFIFGENKVISVLIDLLALGLFLAAGTYAFRYKFAVCPHCKQNAAKLKNLAFPVDPICPKCGKRMDIDLAEE